MRPRRLLLVLATALFGLLPACAIEIDDSGEDADDDEIEPTSAEASELAIRNPVKTDCADPSVMRDGKTYYLTCTGGDGQGNLFPIYASSNMFSWTRVGQVFAKGQAPKWANGNWWAPELHHAGKGFIVVFNARSTSTGKNVIGVAQSSSPKGGFVDKGILVSHPDRSTIDAHVIADKNGKLVLYYKSERTQGKDGKQADVIRAAPLRADGLRTTEPAKTVLTSTETWEGGVVEGPWVMRRGSYYYMFYSGNYYCNASYAVGVARSKSPFGPFEKKSAPILDSGSRWVGPGHNAVTLGPDGRNWMVYHAYKTAEGTPRCNESTPDNDRRHTLVDRIVFKNAWPTVSSKL